MNEEDCLRDANVIILSMISRLQGTKDIPYKAKIIKDVSQRLDIILKDVKDKGVEPDIEHIRRKAG